MEPQHLSQLSRRRMGASEKCSYVAAQPFILSVEGLTDHSTVSKTMPRYWKVGLGVKSYLDRFTLKLRASE